MTPPSGERGFWPGPRRAAAPRAPDRTPRPSRPRATRRQARRGRNRGGRRACGPRPRAQLARCAPGAGRAAGMRPQRADHPWGGAPPRTRAGRGGCAENRAECIFRRLGRGRCAENRPECVSGRGDFGPVAVSFGPVSRRPPREESDSPSLTCGFFGSRRAPSVRAHAPGAWKLLPGNTLCPFFSTIAVGFPPENTFCPIFSTSRGPRVGDRLASLRSVRVGGCRAREAQPVHGGWAQSARGSTCARQVSTAGGPRVRPAPPAVGGGRTRGSGLPAAAAWGGAPRWPHGRGFRVSAGRRPASSRVAPSVLRGGQGDGLQGSEPSCHSRAELAKRCTRGDPGCRWRTKVPKKCTGWERPSKYARQPRAHLDAPSQHARRSNAPATCGAPSRQDGSLGRSISDPGAGGPSSPSRTGTGWSKKPHCQGSFALDWSKKLLCQGWQRHGRHRLPTGRAVELGFYIGRERSANANGRKRDASTLTKRIF